MKDIITSIYAQLNAELERAGEVEPLKLPKIDDELIPFIVREITDEEHAVLSLKVSLARASEKMYRRVAVLDAFNDYAAIDKTKKEDEILRFKAEILDNLFFWYMAEVTGWQYGALMEREHEGKKVLIGFTPNQAREYFDRKTAEAEEKLANLKEPVSSLIN